MKTSLVSQALRFAIKNRFPILLEGAPGVGKSDLVASAAREEKAEFILTHPVVQDPTDYKGLPFPSDDKLSARFLPFGDLARVLAATKKTVFFLDDLGQAPGAVQAACMQLLLARCIGEHKIPDCVTILAATNGRSHRAGVSGILEPVKSRMVSIINVQPDLDDWIVWAYSVGVNPLVIAYLRMRQENFHKFEPTADMKNGPSPRTWNHVSLSLNAGLPAAIELDWINGAIGDAVGGEFVGFARIWRDLVSIEEILLDPAGAKIPTEPSALYAVASGLAHKATKASIGRIIKYANRLMDAGHGDFAAFTVKDCERRCAAVTNSADWRDMLLSDLGKLYQP